MDPLKCAVYPHGLESRLRSHMPYPGAGGGGHWPGPEARGDEMAVTASSGRQVPSSGVVLPWPWRVRGGALRLHSGQPGTR